MNRSMRVFVPVLLVVSLAPLLTACGGGVEGENSDGGSNDANVVSMQVLGTEISRDQNSPTPLWTDTLSVAITFDRQLTQAEKDSVEVSHVPDCVDCPVGTSIWSDGGDFSLLTISYFQPYSNVCISQCSGTVKTTVSGTNIKTADFYWSH